MRLHEHGGPEVLKFEEVDTPVPSKGEVSIAVECCGMNHLDVWVRRGLPNVDFRLPRIPGSDVSGIVTEVGESVTSVRPGEEILIYPALYCNECKMCAAGKQTFCRSYRVIGTTNDGGYAEYIVLPERNVLPKPKRLSFAEAASMPLVFLTAWHILVTLAEVKEGDDVLVHGAGSGVGIAAIQIAKLFGARVFTTSSSDEKLSKAEKLGADITINYTEQSFEKVIRQETGGSGVDVVVEHVGPATWEGSIRALKAGGRLVTCGATTGPYARMDLRHLFSRQLKIYGSYMGTPEELAAALRHIETGELKPVVDGEYALADAAEAHRRMENGGHFGKIIINVKQDG